MHTVEPLEHILEGLRSYNEAAYDRAAKAFEKVWNKAVLAVGERALWHHESLVTIAQTEGGFTPLSTLSLVKRESERTRKFLEAVIHATRAGVRDVIDAGTGSTAILALQAAVRAGVERVLAYEMNVVSADIAREVVRLFGLDQKIEVRGTSVLEH